FASVQRAITAAAADSDIGGDTVLLEPGTYSDYTVHNESAFFSGRALTRGVRVSIFLRNAAGASAANPFTIRSADPQNPAHIAGSGSTTRDDMAILVANTPGVVIQDIHFDGYRGNPGFDSGAFGIVIFTGSSDARFVDNTIIDPLADVQADQGGYVELSNSPNGIIAGNY